MGFNLMKINITTLRDKCALFLAILLLNFVLIGALFIWAWTSSQNAAQLGYQLGTAEAVGAQAENQRNTAIAEANIQATAIFEMKDRAEEQAQTSLARQLSAQAQLMFALDNSKQMTAVLLSAESMRLLPSIEAAQILQNNLLAYPVLELENGVQLYGNQIVNLVMFSRDGKYLVSLNSYGNTVRVWDVQTGNEVSHMTHNFSVWGADISSDNKYVVSESGGQDMMRVWELETGREIARIDSGQLNSVAFSLDGKYVISDTGHIWEALTGKEVTSIPEDEYSIACSPDGKYTLSGSKDEYGNKKDLIFVREIATGNEIAQITHNSRISTVKFSADGKYVTATGCDKTANSGACVQSTAVIWNARTGKQITKLTVDEAWFLVFSPDSQYAISTDLNGIVRVWGVNTGKEVSHITHIASVSEIQFSPNGKYVASGNYDGAAHVWEILTGKEVAHMTRTGGVFSVAFSPDGKYLATGGGDNITRLWKLAAKHEIVRVEQDDPVSHFAVSPNGNYIAIGSATPSPDNIIRIFETSTGKEISQIKVTQKRSSSDLTSLAFSPNNRYVVSGSYVAPIRIWDADTGKEVVRMKYDLPITPIAVNSITTLHDVAVKSVAFSPDGRYVLSSSDDHTARVWDANTGKEISRVTHEAGVTVVAFSPNGKYVLSGGCDKLESDTCVQGSAQVWAAMTGKEIARMTHDYIVSAIAFSPDGKYVVSSGDMTARVWEVLTGKEVARRTCNDGGVLAVAFSPDNKYVISTCNYTVSVWEANTGREIAHMEHLWDVFRTVAFSPDGKYVLAGNVDHGLSIWEIATGQEIGHFSYSNATNFVTFGPEGKYLALSENNTTFIWTWRPQDLIADACSRVIRNLTRAEWQQYFGAALSYQGICPNLPIETEPTATPTP
jgi:WD40 repeat protein